MNRRSFFASVVAALMGSEVSAPPHDYAIAQSYSLGRFDAKWREIAEYVNDGHTRAAKNLAIGLDGFAWMPLHSPKMRVTFDPVRLPS